MAADKNSGVPFKSTSLVLTKGEGHYDVRKNENGCKDSHGSAAPACTRRSNAFLHDLFELHLRVF
jgi:hypothetical protein